MKTIKTNLKPISLDAHFKYRCPSSECTIEHWLSLGETKTKNFKVVCDCGTIFSPKRISKIKIVYRTTRKAAKAIEPIEVVEPKATIQTESPKIPVELLEKSVKILSVYGFTDKEAKELLINSYNKCNTSDIASLVKFTLETFGGKHG
jgi:hypothetical protein